ncbi:unnamed protein product [Arabidopsis lyrata]|uniref:Transmembrane protein n=1 Tax=Arabidopsis lyrata subsp. lyrata TaxID=81972 RepID=D7KMK6_ARALL|nr:uncharacterized protein LOC9326604 isoform X2 [Arabidopsis lyrata subsp. lyrata]EFH66801.1 hypothetical protein ARALYDRAFT_472536 [Arabidopsis lyrata subsp. lyrata]CAH8253255.1 unnamed protein product [Arabidopsis lyrata]|eukprot:XP_020869025.1 uncharacterized protein LOC9326604 isoform X2 [Arabidopsis lyrata subsp. lyrata]
MATKASNLVVFLLSLLLLLLLISFQVGVADAKRNKRHDQLLDYPRPPTAPIYLPPSKSRKGKGP